MATNCTILASSQGTYISSGIFLSGAYANDLTLSGKCYIGISALAGINAKHVSIDMASSHISALAFDNARLDILDIVDLP